ncbi:MAG: hypothetical protein DRQ49_19605 [Gammaproteobacteria bacterium]|nr:MAG: hypothetical protein DRQ49_19605 [Gammaproteobacteria bacterium]
MYHLDKSQYFEMLKKIKANLLYFKCSCGHSHEINMDHWNFENYDDKITIICEKCLQPIEVDKGIIEDLAKRQIPKRLHNVLTNHKQVIIKPRKKK